MNRHEELGGLRAVRMAVSDNNESAFGTLDILGPAYQFLVDMEMVRQLWVAVKELEDLLM